MKDEAALDYADQLRKLEREMETLRCRQSLFRTDPDLIRELLELRAFFERHPAPPVLRSAPTKPKSELVRNLETVAIFNEYADREISRLGRKVEAMKGHRFDALSAIEDAGEKDRNYEIFQCACAHGGIRHDR